MLKNLIKLFSSPQRKNAGKASIRAGSLFFVCTLVIAVIVSSSGVALGEEEVPATTMLGDPLLGLNNQQLQDFRNGREAFLEVEDIEDGLGPAFNERGCANCHNIGAIGGSGVQFEVRAGRLINNNFNPLENRGGSLFQIFGIGLIDPNCPFTGENVPKRANVIALRETTQLFGLGLVDATADQTIINIRANQPAAVRGRVNMVFNISAGRNTVGKFGWKAQVPTLFQFAGDAYLNEIGITNPQFPNENLPQGNAALLAQCDRVPDPEDDGEDVQLFTDFMQLLAPPPRGPITAQVKAGDALFTKLGCDQCHIRNITSAPNPIDALSKKTFHPFSDFLVHDMGSLGDRIVQGEAGPREMRTAPLWGIRFKVPVLLLHDGRAQSIRDAILAHDGQGAASRNAFKAVSPNDQENLIAFVNSL